MRYTAYDEEYTVFCIAPLCLGIIVYIYTGIYIKVRRHQIPGYRSSHQETVRHTKALITTLLNIGAFLLSWFPLCLFQIILIIKVHTDIESIMANQDILKHATYHLYNLLIMHTIADPIIYTVRMKEVGIHFGYSETCYFQYLCNERYPWGYELSSLIPPPL